MSNELTLMQRIRGEWWWRVSRHFNAEEMQRKIAHLIPRKIALFVFVRVFAAGDEGPHYLDAYEHVYKAWENGAGR